MNELLENAAGRASRYLATSRSARSRRLPRRSRGSTVLREPLPAGPSEAADVLALLDEIGSPATMAIAGPRFFGFVIGGVAARRPGRQLAGDGLGSERRLRLGRRRPPSLLEAVALELDARPLRPARGLRGRVRHRRDDGQLQRARRGPARGARGPGLGRRGRRAVRRAADHGRDRRGGAPDADQGARPRRASGATGSCACPSTARAACAPTRCRRSRRATIVCAQAGNVNTGAFDPLAEIAAAHARGRGVAARRRRVRPVGRGRARVGRTCVEGSASPTRGRRTRTSG